MTRSRTWSIAITAFALAVHPSVPANDLNELIAYAKANPGRLAYGSAGTGSLNHLTAEAFKLRVVIVERDAAGSFGSRLRRVTDICLVAHLTSAKMLCDSDQAPYPTARRIHDACMQIEAFALEHPLRQAGAQTTASL